MKAFDVVFQSTDGTDDETPGDGYYAAKASKKREKKQQEREAQRQSARESRRTKQDHYDEIRRKKDEKHEAREWMLEEEAKARKAEEEAAAALSLTSGKGLLFDFMEYIKNHKCIPLEDIDAEFKLRTQVAPIFLLMQYGFWLMRDCINRITSLENMGRLSGVMDDRGKYIYISLEEMKAVADYIKHEGRVSISHLASKSNQFLDLESKAQLVEDISSITEITVA
ncbi:DDRGK domain-containing 1 [Olea europaea subsp. europaea]|uniref:DDRGK domain-containing 1 n=1 Tax=Olea europaea subsp. europaea TaxID=158383 RepID=A0A8S0V532_OLEEU|nr:DDRGK domain-containing 1 [Olea europaea subsp. europaea]